MAGTSYYSKKKEESDKKINEALAAKKKRSTEEETTQASLEEKKKASESKVNAALASRAERVQNSLPSVLSDIEKLLTVEINSYNSTKPTYGAYDETYKSQRERRISISKLRNKVNAYRNYMDSSVADSIISTLDNMVSGYDAYLGMSKYKDQNEYDTAVRQYGYWQEYQGMDYLKLRDEWAKLDPGTEKAEWLKSYMPSTLTGNDIDSAIAEVDKEIGSLSKFIDQWGNLDVWYNDYVASPSSATYDLTEQQVQERLSLYRAIMDRFGSFDGMRKTLDAKKEELWSLNNHKQYGLLEENEDFYDVAKAVSENTTAGFGIQWDDTFYGQGDEVYDYINDINGSRERIRRSGDRNDGDARYYKYSLMEPEEIARYNYLFHKEGEDSAYKYLEYLEPTLNARQQGEIKEKYAAWTNEVGGWASVVSVPASLLSGIGVIDAAGQGISNWWHELNTGEYAGPVDFNRPSMTFGNISNTIRGERAAYYNSLGTINLKEEDHPFWSKILNGKGWGDVYQLGMSMADSAASAGLAKIGMPGASALLGGAAGTQGVLDALNKGATDEQAILMGLLNGTFEMLFESVSIDKLINGNPKSFISALLTQGGIEATEEGATTFANIVADCIVMAEKSDLSRSIAEYLKAHPDWTEEQARTQALWDAAIQLGWDMVGGALSGGIMGGGSYAVDVGADFYSTTKQKIEDFKNTYSADPGALVGEALEINPNNKFAQRMQGKLDDGKSLSLLQLNHLVHQNEKALTAQDKAAIQSATEARLTELGETGDVSAIAAALTKQATGKKLSTTEQNTIANSKYGQRVANELNTENIRSGEYASAWAENIGTERINVEEYSRLVEAAMQPQEAAEATGGKVVTDVPKVAQTQQTEPVAAAEKPAAAISKKETVPANDQQVTGKLTGEESSAVEAPKAKSISLEEASKRYGAQAQAMIHTYKEGQDVAKYDAAYRLAYNWGQSGVSTSYMNRLMDENAELSGSDKTIGSVMRYLTKEQAQLAYDAGAAASDTSAKALDAEIKSRANGKTGRKEGVVRGDGVTVKDLKDAFNDTQGMAYRYLTDVARATGIDFVLYRSEAGKDGKFRDAQGRYRRDDPGTIYIDLNAGLVTVDDVKDLHKYAMLRTFSHEFCHFIEFYNPVQYNEFRKLVFDTQESRGMNVHARILAKQKKGLTYEAASREVLAESMVDVLPQSSFVQDLAQNHRNIFQWLLDKLKEFVDNIKRYYKTIGGSYYEGATALKEQVGNTTKYLDSIVDMFDRVAAGAVENFQRTVATDEVVASKKETTTTVSETKVETKAQEVETKVEEKAPVVEKDAHGFTISDNVEHGSLEIAFDSKPSAAVIDALKENKFRWHKAKKVWYGYGDRQTITDAIHAAYEAETTEATESPAMETLRDMGAKPAGENMLDVTDLFFPELAQKTAEESLAPATAAIKAVAEDKASVYGDETVATVPFADRQYVVQHKSDGTYTVSVVGKGSGFVANDMSKDGFSSFAEAAEYAIRWILANDQEFKTKWRKTYAELTETAVNEPVTQKPEITHTPGDAYDELADMMGKRARFEHGNFVYRVHKAGNDNSMWQGHIDAADVSANGVYVTNARGIHYASELYKNREDALSDIIETARASKLLDEKPTETTKPKEEVIDNGITENGTDTPAVHEPVRGSEGSARLLEGVEPAAVQGGNEGRQPVQSGSDQGTGDAGRNRRADAPGNVSERSTGNRVGGDLQQLPAVTETVTDTNVGDKSAEDTNVPSSDPVKLHEIVVDLTAQRSTENPKGSNFVIGDSLNLPNGTKARTRANIDAIKLVKQIAAEGRIATPAEQEILSKYVGWGGLADAFGKPVSNYTTRKIEYEAVKGLEAEFEELKTVLTEEEYKSARESTKNAHYTSIEVIKAMYDGLKQLGFTGGRMLEPSSGVGNFVGAMPADMTSQVKSWTMVELDNITGLFAKYLYPNADVRIQGFEEANIPDGYMDVAIGNVPFGNYAITDKHYPKAVTSAIHNYFFAKSLDKVRTGGIVMFITSAYTMNSRDNAVRKYIMQRADLLGAIRLPNTAFAGNAGTSVVTDILILKKRADKTAYAGEAFENSDWQRLPGSYDGAYFNEYFAQHPEMVLGKPKLSRGMYSANELTYDPFTDRGTLGDQIRSAMQNIKGKMDYSVQPSAERQSIRQATAKKKGQKLQVKDGVIHAKDENGNLTRVDVDKDTAERITGMVAIRDAHTALCDALQQGVTKKEITSLRKALNKAYDAFVEKYGYLNSNKNKKAINAFADRYAILSLENYSTEGKKIVATKSDIFSKDTIAANKTAASAENVEEGLTISLNTVGSVDVSMIARLTGQKVESVTRQLIDQRLVFKDKDGNLIPAAQYLSGNVRAKLREMEGLVGIDKDYQNNVEALREVVPPTVQHTDIYVNPGANWVPVEMYEGFVGYILKRTNYVGYRTGKKDFSVEYVPETNEYKVSINDAYAKMSAQNTQVWGEGGKAFSTIFENMLNGRRTNVYMEGADGKRVLDKAKTEAVAEKVEKLNEEFRKWLWEDETRRNEMQELYNESYNALVTPKYSGASLTVNGLNSEYDLRPHQKDAVARIINSGGNTLLAHRVGAGKTMEMAAAAMKLKQLGVIKKPMFVVPNNVVAQWGKEFKDYFPAANILLVGDEDMTPAERMTTINKIKNNDYDAVILAYTKFEKIQMTSAWRQKFYEEQIESIMFAINAEKESQGGKGFTVKQLENKRKQLEARVKKLTEKAKDDDGAMFEDLGVDSLFVDEAHNFKNLEYSTRMSNVSGLGKAEGAQRSFDLYTKVRYLQQLNGGRGVVFATATPVMNSMTEMYIMQKYLQPDTLKQLGIEHFDSWAKMFGEVVNALEIAPSGSGYRLKQTFSKFKNVKALQQLFRSFTDVLTDVPGLKIPKMKGRKVQIVECEQGEFQKHYMEELAKRAENVKNVDPTEDNMLKITSDGRKISYSQRMIDPSLPYEETGKIYKCCENVFTVYQESNATKGTQMIFCDMATPKGKASAKTETETNADEFSAVDMESAQLYDDIKSRLVQLGIPAKEIAFIHDAKNDKQKAELSEKMNNGTIRVLIGSTGKMGVGLNAQKKAIAIHHLDAPWRPGDIEQRDGRVFRQKNQNEEAYKFVYVTRGSFDSRLWDILERKQKFINQVMNGEDVGNEIEDTGEVTLSAAEVKAVASDNPLIMEQVALEKEISKLQSLQQAHRANVSRAEEKIVSDRRNIANLENLISNLQEDIKSRKDTYSSDKVFSIQIGTQTFTDKKDAGAALVAAAEANAKEGSYTAIGKFAGFTLRVVKTPEGVKGMVAGAGNYDFKTYPLAPTQGINHLIAVVEGFEERLAMLGKNLSETKSDLETQMQLAAQPFEQADKLKEKRTRYNEVMYILNPPTEQTVADDTVQEQSRDYYDGWNSYELSDEFLREVAYGDRHSFLRSLANQTVGIEEGTTRNIVINGEGTVYFFKATGYMNGRIERKKAITDNNQALLMHMRKEYKNAYTRTETLDQVAKAHEMQRGRDGWDNAATGHPGVSGQDDAVDGEESGSDTFGSTWESFGYNSWEEFQEAIEGGAMFIDDYGNVYAKEQFQQRENTLTDRDVLAIAASEINTSKWDDGEKDALRIFTKRLNRLEALQTERTEQGRLYKEQQFGAKVDRAKAAETLNRMHELDEQISKAAADVLDVENKEVLRRVLKKARTVVEQQDREHFQGIMKRRIDRMHNAEAIKKYRNRLRGDVDDLTNWMLHPDNKSVVKHIPDALKNTVIPFLRSINFMSKRSLGGGNPTQADKAFMEQLRKLAKVMENTVEVDEMYSNYNDLPPDFMKNLRSFMDTAQQLVDKNTGEYIINQMTAAELQSLSKVVRTLKKYIMQMNRFHVNAMFQHVSDAGESSIEFMAPLKPAENTGAVSNFVLWQQMRPAYAFERFGEGGKAIYDGLRRGQATLAFNTKKIQAFAEKAYTTAEVNAWESQVKTIRIGPGKIVKMPVSYIMGLYELSKREQAQGHIFGEGIRVATFKANGKKISDVGQTLTPGELNMILRELTPRQKEVADKLQQFMQQQGGEWGNYVTIARFGEKQFGEENYFPINSDGRHLQVDADEKPGAAALYALLNMGFTKQTQEKAKNRLIVYSIFDVFSNHMASMAQYNAFALPVIDALKWFNYQQVEVAEDGSKTILGSVREQMDRAFGVPEENRPGSGKRGYAQSFVINIIKALNGTEAQGTAYDSLGMKMLHNYNRAQIAYNLRVVVQQPLAITRAAQLIDYASIIKGMKLSPSAIQKNIEEMLQYSGIASWKDLGFYDVNISRGLTSLIKHDDTLGDKIVEFGTKGAEWADKLTWAAIWSAAKEEVIRKQKIKPNDKGFYEAVTKLFEDVIYKTQVVDSVLTKNEFMRDKGFLARSVGSFMSEPTTTASMLVDAYDKFQMDMQRGMTRQQAWKKNSKMIVRTAYVYGIGAILLAAVQAVADAFRDDDDYQEWYEKWLEAFGGNLVDELMPFNKLPIISEVYEFVKELISVGGFDIYGQMSNFVWTDIAEQLVKGVEIIYGKITGEEDRYTWYGGAYKLLQAVSGITGLPMAAATREIITAWNNTVGAMAPSLKVKTYDSGDKNEIKYAYQDGYLTEEEATALLLEKGVVDTEDEAYFTIRGWDAGEGYSKYDAIYDAVRNGGDITAAMQELTSHGHNKSDVLSQVKEKIGKWYQDGEITKQQATNMLTKYFDMDSDEITETVNKWSCKVVTGIAYGDIKDEFLKGNITEARAIEMIVRYGGKTKNAAKADVQYWAFKRDYPNVYVEDSWFDTYQEKIAASGIRIDVYMDYRNKVTGITGDDKKQRRMNVIHSLPISSAQKDALYYAEGWAASKIHEAPWH